MGFDAVDKKFQPKQTWVRLECENCGRSPGDVQKMWPLWFNGHQRICLCSVCGALRAPTAYALVQQRDAALFVSGYTTHR